MKINSQMIINRTNFDHDTWREDPETRSHQRCEFSTLFNINIHKQNMQIITR